jgi:hypothetical protein
MTKEAMTTDDKKTGGRPPKAASDKATAPLSAHATESAAAAIRQRAADAELTVSQFLIACALSPERTPDPDARARQERALFHIRKIGTNANTLARAWHSSRRSGNEPPPTESEIDKAARELRETLKAFREAYQF